MQNHALYQINELPAVASMHTEEKKETNIIGGQTEHSPKSVSLVLNLKPETKKFINITKSTLKFNHEQYNVKAFKDMTNKDMSIMTSIIKAR